jgi:hypothetical protein
MRGVRRKLHNVNVHNFNLCSLPNIDHGEVCGMCGAEEKLLQNVDRYKNT